MRLASPDPRTWVYFLVHIVLVLTGFFVLHAPRPWGDDVAVSIGSSFIAAGLAGMVVYAYVRVSERRSRLLSLLIEFGFIAAFDGRAAKIKAEYDARLTKAKEGIDILGFGLNQMRQDYEQRDFEAWAARAKVRILLIDPDFPSPEHSLAYQRDAEEREKPGIIRDQVLAFVSATRQLISRNPNFHVRLYRCLPTVNVFRVDDELFWGPYLVGRPSRNTPTFVVKSGGILFRSLTDHFDKIWQDDSLSRPVPREWLEDHS